MAKILKFIFFAIVIVQLTKAQTNYCGLESCSSGTQTLCLYDDPEPNSRCTNYETVGITAAQQQQILDLHNQFRQRVASGSETRGSPGPQPSATRMPDLKWDDELARVAQRWAIQCTNSNDQCRNVERFTVGQNVGVFAYSDNVIEDIITQWYDQVQNYNAAEVPSYTGQENNGVTRDYTQLVWNESFFIGCGAIVYFGRFRQLYLVCNYGPSGNHVGQPVYF